MIDIPDKTEALMARLEAALPVPARPTPEVLKALRQQAVARTAAPAALRHHRNLLCR